MPGAHPDQPAALPVWWRDFLVNVSELEGRNSPADEPDAMVATAAELEGCALRAIEGAQQQAAPALRGGPADPYFDWPNGSEARRRAAAAPPAALTTCAAGSDGDCTHRACPQLRDGEPIATGRHCPLDAGRKR